MSPGASAPVGHSATPRRRTLRRFATYSSLPSRPRRITRALALSARRLYSSTPQAVLRNLPKKRKGWLSQRHLLRRPATPRAQGLARERVTGKS